MAPEAQETSQSGKRVLFSIIAFMAGTILLVVLAKHLIG